MWKEQFDSYTGSMWIGAIILIICSLLMIIYKYIDLTIAVMVLIGVMAIMSNFFSYIGMSEPLDERLKKIGTLSATYSWYVSLVFTCFFVYSSHFINMERTTTEIFGVTIFIMVTSMMIINTFLRWKGDVQ
ncbi:hypothetical protein [Methanobacterium alcaliphilum]|uniref:hypothetical protein n=1 Tax=Methanobacterium alcaliphilum TaxID=392018 RepID=UPI00200A5E0C|nr:hypothetical protein [Methanobacterium alcaliphilum]MCK9152444.1 hypothetical protein [Methanobacterium alcaliphilum]